MRREAPRIMPHAKDTRGPTASGTLEPAAPRSPWRGRQCGSRGTHDAGTHREPGPQLPVRRAYPPLPDDGGRRGHRRDRRAPPSERVLRPGREAEEEQPPAHARRLRAADTPAAERDRQRGPPGRRPLAHAGLSAHHGDNARAACALAGRGPRAPPLLLPGRSRRNGDLSRGGRRPRRRHEGAQRHRRREHPPQRRPAARGPQDGDRLGQDRGHGDASSPGRRSTSLPTRTTSASRRASSSSRRASRFATASGSSSPTTPATTTGPWTSSRPNCPTASRPRRSS